MAVSKPWAAFGAAGIAALGLAGAAVAQQTGTASSDALPRVQYHQTDKLEIVHEFRDQMPVGVALTSTGRVFVSYPRWEDPLKFTLGELKNGKEVPWPRGGEYQTGHQKDSRVNLVSLQGIHVDGRDRLWALDTGTLNMEPITPFSPKVICYDTKTGEEAWKLELPPDVAPPGTYLNDIRVDLSRGPQGTAYITDSGKKPGLIVIDLASKRAMRRLAKHPSVHPDKEFVGFVEGRSFFKMPRPDEVTHVAIGADGIAISPDGQTLYYTALSGRRLYSVPCASLADPAVPDESLGALVKDLGDKGVTDGMRTDTAGRVYTTNWEQNAILRRLPDGRFETVVHDPRLLWPDTLDISRDGQLYIISNQLHRQAGYNGGKDRRQKPYLLTRVKIDAGPALPGASDAAAKTAKR